VVAPSKVKSPASGSLEMKVNKPKSPAVKGAPFQDVRIVAVSGDGPNFCGHSLLFIDVFYYHVNALYDYPQILTPAQYADYLRASGKKELWQRKVQVRYPKEANAKLQELLKQKWLWGAIPHNCFAFVEDVLAAGGVDASCWHNCPQYCK
jgi:hypothetical protein